ncbi:MAG: LysR family transcriptional regulator [Bacteroidaceae bacterium]|nr:LysR family transcriptional regulator [Bacteroidaceae bacterium]
MTLQQLKYIVAIDKFRNFAKAADACEISQPTLSAMLAKLEDELDVRIFERNNKNVKPTVVGEKLLAQARKVVMEAGRIEEIAAEEKNSLTGKLTLSIGTTIAPYILPQFIKKYTEAYPGVELVIREMKTPNMLAAVQSSNVDAAIAIAGNSQQGLFEIPLYTEKFYVYLSENCWRKLPVFKPENLEHEQMWIMKDAQCLRESAFSFCKARSKGKHIYEAGSVETLVRVVDINGGFTIIPELHIPFLADSQRQNIRSIDGDFLSQRRVSLYIREDYIRERMLNSITDVLLKILPLEMFEERIKKFGIKL